jgi:hypothetical protein
MNRLKIAQKLVGLARMLVAKVKRGDVYKNTYRSGWIGRQVGSQFESAFTIVGEDGDDYVVKYGSWTPKKAKIPKDELHKAIRSRWIVKGAFNPLKDWTDKTWEAYVKQNLSKLVKPVLAVIKRSIVPKMLKEAEKETLSGAVINGELVSRDYHVSIQTDITPPSTTPKGLIKGVTPAVAASRVKTFRDTVNKVMRPITFTLPMEIDGEIYDAVYKGTPKWSYRTIFLRGELQNEREIAEQVPDKGAIEENLNDMAVQLREYLDDAIESWAVDVFNSQGAPDIEVEYEIDPGQRGSRGPYGEPEEPSWDPYVEEMYWRPDNMDWTEDWDTIASASNIDDEIRELDDLEADYDLVKVAKIALRSFGAVKLDEVEVPTNVGKQYVPAVVTIKKIDPSGITFNIKLPDAPPDSVAKDIMESLSDY